MEARKLVREQWMRQVSLLKADVSLAEKYIDELIRSYSEPSRHYHTLAHLQALLTFADEYKNQLSYPSVVDFAIFYHDIVYKASRSDNEEQSARIADEQLTQLKFPGEEKQIVIQFIQATKSHSVSPSPFQEDLKWFLDFDLSILGAEEEIYFEYVRQIREEFKIYPDLLYKPGRRKVLQHFLNREFIYKTDEFRKRFETKARLNLQKESEQLK